MKNLFRNNIKQMNGYTPGEQPKDKKYIKLNTNENPYPPSPKIIKILKKFDYKNLRLYPDPTATSLISAAAKHYNVSENNILAGNGSDDILTIAIRAIAGENDKIAYPTPSYSLYPELTDIQGSLRKPITLKNDFSLPKDILSQLKGTSLFIIPNPNAPSGNLFDKALLKKICREYEGIVLIDEAYAEFASDTCLDFSDSFSNVIVSRTLSKSFSLAAIRIGFAIAQPEIIKQLSKAKDSYNTNMLSQLIAQSAIKDFNYTQQNITKIIATRNNYIQKFEELGWNIIPSETNFIFAKPFNITAEKYFHQMRENGILIRYFPGKNTGKYVRITIGTNEEMNSLYKTTLKIMEKN
ncbi:MAG: histidinol-phosphate transaminase [Verrucomicrobiota bacterium]|nr:histidinol-phosphate transaminase [Verrucomicrobiota bacterium]